MSSSLKCARIPQLWLTLLGFRNTTHSLQCSSWAIYDVWDLVLNAFPNHPITGQKISPDQYTITAELNAGHPVLINVGVGKFSAVGHFMILAGMDANGNFILNDPNNLENCSKTWPWEDLSSEITAAWSYSYNG